MGNVTSHESGQCDRRVYKQRVRRTRTDQRKGRITTQAHSMCDASLQQFTFFVTFIWTLLLSVNKYFESISDSIN